MMVLSKMPGTPLPKRLLRPFNYYESAYLDDKQYKLPSGHDKKEFFAVIWILPAVVFIGFLLILLGVISTGDTKYWFDHNTNFIPLFVGSFLLTAIIYVLSKVVKNKKFTVFDRENGMVTIPRVFLPGPRLYVPWEEFTGRVILTSSYVGAARHELLLMHIPSCKGWFLDASILDVYSVLGFWSFLVQYMDKTKPLPNVPPLRQYGDVYDGLGSWKDWEMLENSKGFVDPYYTWLAEVKANPELDEVNYLIEQRVLGKA